MAECYGKFYYNNLWCSNCKRAASLCAEICLDRWLGRHQVRIWLFENGVYLAKKDQKPAQGLTNYGQLLEDLVKGDVEVKACVVCAEARGLKQVDLIEGVKLATIHELVEWTTSSDKVITF
mgnify:CR=1 FL=1